MRLEMVQAGKFKRKQHDDWKPCLIFNNGQVILDAHGANPADVWDYKRLPDVLSLQLDNVFNVHYGAPKGGFYTSDMPLVGEVSQVSVDTGRMTCQDRDEVAWPSTKTEIAKAVGVDVEVKGLIDSLGPEKLRKVLPILESSIETGRHIQFS